MRLAVVLVAICAVSACNTLEVENPARPTPLTAATDPTEPDAGRQPTQYPSTGEELMAYVSQQHPDRLAARVDYGERVRNMEFLRDEVIRIGMCGGMDLGRNLKRGVGPHSIDAIAWKHDGNLDVVDIASAYDDTGIELRLHWLIVDGPAGFDPIARPDCK
jgi:hypothetical protein